MRKNKVYITILLIVISQINAFAQSGNGYNESGRLGVRLGAVYSKIKLDEETNKLMKGDDDQGFQVGAFYKFNVNKLYLKFGLDYTFITTEVLLFDYAGSPDFPSTGEDEELSLKFSSFDVPMLLGFNMGNFRIDIGPVINFLVKAEGEFNDSKSDVTEDFRGISMGVRAGIGYDVGNISLDLKYESSLSRIGETIYVLHGQEHVLKNQRYNLSLSYQFKPKRLGNFF